MHFLTLVTVDIPPQVPDTLMDRMIAEQIEHLKNEMEATQHPYLHSIAIEKCNSHRDSFSRAVANAVDSVMERYYFSTKNPEYLNFFDYTEEMKKEYATEKVDCFQLAEGRIVPYYDYRVCGRFIIREGKVYKKHCGPLQHEKRNKQAKRMKAFPDYPVSKIYPSYGDYAEEAYGYSYYEEQDGYGYYYNPNGFWDWYSIGGRWPEMFLVKEECAECSIGDRTWTCSDELHKAPEGYKWVCAARKKDIEWQVLRDWKLQEVKEQFPEDTRYFIHFYDYLDTEVYQNMDSFLNGQEDDAHIGSWDQVVADYIDSLDDDTVLVGVDHHE